MQQCAHLCELHFYPPAISETLKIGIFIFFGKTAPGNTLQLKDAEKYGCITL